MKKALFISCYLVISQLVLAQNFELFKNDGAYYFNTTNTKAYEITRSNQVENGTYFYSYDIGLLRFAEDGTVSDPHTSWLGDSIFVDLNGITTFHNHYGKSLVMKPFFDLEPWIVYSESNGAYIEAKYTGFETAQILYGLEDLVATLVFTVYDSLGNPFTNHAYQEFVWKVSGAHGSIKQFSINDFRGIYYNDDNKSPASSYTLSGFETEEENIGFEYSYKNLVTHLEIGSEVNYTYQNENNFEVKRKIIDKIIDDSLCTYTFQSCIHEYNYYGFDTVYSLEYEQAYDYNLKLNEIINSEDDEGFKGFLFITDMDRFSFKYRLYHKTDDWFYYGKPCWLVTTEHTYSMGTPTSHIFIDGLGDFIPYRGSENNGDERVYFKTPTEEWGTPLEFSCPDASSTTEIAKHQIQIYPNPAEDMIYINQNNQRIDLVNIYDLQSRLVKQFELTSQTSLDVSDLEKGVYLIEILSGNKLISHQKILIY